MQAERPIPSSVSGIGIDIVENSRMAGALARHGDKFKDRVFLKSEQDYCDAKASPALHYASRFAVKEAVAKAFGTGIGAELGWLDIEVTRLDAGAPAVHLLGKGETLARRMRIANVFVSLSHTHHYATATAILTRACGGGSA